MSRILKSGAGWRLGWDEKAAQFKGLVGGDNWAMELTEAELDDFCRLLGELAKNIEEIAKELMDEEKIACEAESDRLWMQLEGYPQSYTVEFILNTGRRGEGKWPVEAVPGLVLGAQTLRTF